eukprot:superscaffoldBa00007785_g22825
MMDVPTANQSQTPCQQWAGQNGWSTASPQGPPPFNPLPSFQHLNLGFTSDQIPSYDHLQPSNQGCLSHPRNNTHHSLVANVESAVNAGYIHNHAVPTSPAQQQPQWTLPPYNRGAINEFVPDAAAQERSNAPQSPNSESRYGLDPELLPSAVKVMAEDRAEWEGKVFVSEPFSHLPPLATTSCIIEDRGNASPCVIRSTSYCVPCEGQTALLSRLPLGALVTPLAKQNAKEKPLPLCKESECIVGCSWCGASMCPAMGWQDCGQRFYCPFCGKLNEVSWQHYQPTKGVDGFRVDKDTRPELHMGSYEILNSQKGEPAALILAIDVSASALRGGHLEFVTQQIHSLLTSLNR